MQKLKPHVEQKAEAWLLPRAADPRLRNRALGHQRAMEEPERAIGGWELILSLRRTSCVAWSRLH